MQRYYPVDGVFRRRSSKWLTNARNSATWLSLVTGITSVRRALTAELASHGSVNWIPVQRHSWSTGFSTRKPISDVSLLIAGATGWVIRQTGRMQSQRRQIDDLYIYDRALSPTEVSTLYSVVPEPNTALLLGMGLCLPRC